MKNDDKNLPATESVNKPRYVCIAGCGTVSEDRVKCRVRGCKRFRNYLTDSSLLDDSHPIWSMLEAKNLTDEKPNK